VHVKHQLKPFLELNDPINIPKIANFEATMYNVERNTKANLDMKMLLPLSYIQYQ
jgi:hypothetical protein